MQEDPMNLRHLFVAVLAALIILGTGAANAAQTVNEAGALACVTGKWDEKEVETGHKLVDYAARCVVIPDDAPRRNTPRIASENTSTCPMRPIRAAGPAPLSSKRLEIR
jgi:hypothetical protein